MENASVSMALPSDMDVQPSSSFAFGGSRPSYYAAVATILLLAWWLTPGKQASKTDAPFYKASIFKWIFDAETLIKDSYFKFQDKVYQIKATEGLQVMMPPKYIAEVKGLPEDVLSAKEAIADALQSKYTKFSPGHNGELLKVLVQTRLTQNLVRLVPQLTEELEHIIGSEFPVCDDWTPVKWQPFGLRIISKMAGRAFVGPSLCRDEQWIKTNIDFTINVFLACAKLQFFPEWSRPVAKYLVSDIGKIRGDIECAKKTLKPVLEQRIQEMASGSGAKPADDMMQWLIDTLPADEKFDLHTHAELQLIIATGAIHTTANALCECMYDLAANPDAQENLRQEAHQVLVVENGWQKKETFPKLKKLDSFMKESQRLNGNITSFIRKAMKPISLSDGTRLPAGTKVLAPLAAISRDERYFPEPQKFDALRFYELRQESAEASNRWQFTSMSDTNLHFGAGKHACPGRFFASNNIKLIVAYIVLNFEVRLKPGETRPQPVGLVMTKAPNSTAELEFRRRTVA